jgi:hypothetical protein
MAYCLNSLLRPIFFELNAGSISRFMNDSFSHSSPVPFQHHSSSHFSQMSPSVAEIDCCLLFYYALSVLLLYRDSFLDSLRKLFNSYHYISSIVFPYFRLCFGQALRRGFASERFFAMIRVLFNCPTTQIRVFPGLIFFGTDLRHWCSCELFFVIHYRPRFPKPAIQNRFTRYLHELFGNEPHLPPFFIRSVRNLPRLPRDLFFVRYLSRTKFLRKVLDRRSAACDCTPERNQRTWVAGRHFFWHFCSPHCIVTQIYIYLLRLKSSPDLEWFSTVAVL